MPYIELNVFLGMCREGAGYNGQRTMASRHATFCPLPQTAQVIHSERYARRLPSRPTALSPPALLWRQEVSRLPGDRAHHKVCVMLQWGSCARD